MGDKGGKKDKEKSQHQQVKKHQQKEQVRLDKAKPLLSSGASGAVRGRAKESR